MANPFLMDDDLSTGDTNDPALNPFLMEGSGQEDSENPFVVQANNPFAGFGDDNVGGTNGAPPTTVADIFMVSTPAVDGNSFHTADPAMSFFGTTINEDDPPQTSEVKNPQLAQFDDGKDAYSSEEELGKKKAPPPPRPVPPSQTTQDLIFAVADQLDQASSQMLGRLPATRTPSPVSMRDLHSPSPIHDGTMADLLDVSDDSRPSTSQGGDFEVDLIGGVSDNPFAPTSMPNLHGAAPAQPIAKAQPTRPPPPRPVPPRPVPPSVQPTQVPSVQPDSAPQEPDLFDMFGDTTPKPAKPPAQKTKEDILSLFSAPRVQPQPQPTQPDLLSGDILLDNIPSAEAPLPPPLTEVLSQPIMPPTAPPVTQPVAQPVADSVPQTEVPPEEESTVSEEQILEVETKPEVATEELVQSNDIQGDKVPEAQPLVMDSIAPATQIKRAPTPDIEITTVEDLPRSDDEEELPPPPPPQVTEHEPTEIVEKVDLDQSESAALNQAPTSPMDTSIPDHTSEPEQMDTGLDFVPSIPSGQASANPFASPESEEAYPPVSTATTNIFATNEPLTAAPATNIFAVEEPLTATSATNIFAVDPSTVTNIFEIDSSNTAPVTSNTTSNAFGLDPLAADEFDAFSAKFESVKKEETLLDGFGGVTPTTADAWGKSDAFGATDTTGDGFGNEEGFDSFLAMGTPVEPESPEDKEFSVVIRPKEGGTAQSIAPILAPPPPPPRGSQNNSIYSGDSSPRVNPFDKGDEVASAEGFPEVPESASMQRTDSQETPPTPLFDEDVSQPLEDFPRLNYTGPGWEMQLRQPNKKKITGQRFWKKVFIRLVFQGDNPVLQLFNQQGDKEPFQELPLQPSYSVSDIGAQQYDQFGKIFTVKLQYIFYKERPGVRPGQVTKAERITNKLSQFAAYAIQGDYQGVKEFGSDLKKLGLPVEHAPQVSQLFKIGSMSFEDLKQFSVCVEEALFKLSAHRDRALNYKMEEVQITAVDEIYVEQDFEGHVHKQIARVRLFFLGFLSGMPTIELGLNDLVRQGKEVVGRHDIIPVVTEEWIRLEGVEFHNSVQQDQYERTRTIRFQPPDACYIELMRFRVRPPKNRELPLQLKASWCVTGNRVELRADVLVPGFASRKLGQIPCEDVSIRFPIPECWIYLFRVEKHFRYGSVKSAHRRTGKIKGIERILGTVDTLQESLIEVTSGQAKYEHQHRALVWRCPRLPKEGQGAYTTHQLVCRMALTSYDQIPEQLAPYCYVEFTMPATQVSHTTVRSVSVQDSDSDDPPEKYVRYLARHEYRVGIEHTAGESPNAYLAATRVKEERPQPQPIPSPIAASDSDSDSN